MCVKSPKSRQEKKNERKIIIEFIIDIINIIEYYKTH